MFKKDFLSKLILVFIITVSFVGLALAQDLMKAGKLYDEKKYSEAYSEFERLYKKDSKNTAALNGMAWSRFQLGRILKAESIFKTILRKEPFHAGAKQGLAAVTAKRYERFNRAWNQYYRGDFKGAASSFKVILEDRKRPLPEKEIWRVYIGLGYSYYGDKEYSEAGRQFKKSLKKKENYDAYKGIGQVKFQTKNYKAAINAFKSSLKLNPVQYDVSTLIAWSYFRSGKIDKAIAGFKKQIAKDPYVADVHYGLALSLNKKGDRKAAKDEFYAVISLLPGYLTGNEFFEVLKSAEEYKPLYKGLGWALYYAGLSKESLNLFEMGLKEDPGNAELLRGAGFAALKIREMDKAIKYSKKSLSIAPELPPVFETSFTPAGLPFRFFSNARTTLAWAYFYKKKYANAAKEFKKALKTRPDWPDANSGLGWVYFSRKKYSDAEEQFNRAIKLDPTYNDAYSGLAAVRNVKLGRSGEGWKYYYLGQYDKAVEIFNKASKEKKDLSKEAMDSIERGLGWSHLRLKEYNEADRHFKKLIKANSNDSDAILGLGYVLYDKDDFAGAINRLQTAVKAFVMDIDAEIALGWSYYKTGNFADSLVEFRRAAQLNPNLAEPHRGVGFSLLKLGRVDEGKASLVKAINLFPQTVDNDEFKNIVKEEKGLKDLYIALSWSYYNSGLFDKALEKAKLITGEYQDLDMLLGFIYFKNKQYDNAVKVLERFASAAPGSERGFGKYSQAIYNLAWSYYNKKDYSGALRTFERLVKLHEEDNIWAAPYDGMGWTHLKMGNRTRAKEMFNKGLQLAPMYASSLAGLKELTTQAED